jgi:tetraacyldisaccharide 4'-kinase
LGNLYAAIARGRRALYRAGKLKARPMPVPVVSVGNILAGGGGKTPLCQYLARALAEVGLRVGVVSRGYGRQKNREFPDPIVVSRGEGPLVEPEFAGDEPYWLAQKTEALVVVSRDRPLGALALARLGAEILILDDGFQRLDIPRQVNLLALPAENAWGNGHVMPAGPLRESPQAHLAATALVAMGDKRTAAIERLAEGRPLFWGATRPSRLVDAKSQKEIPFEALRGVRHAAFCGIARDANFIKTLATAGLNPVAWRSFPDHARYLPEERELLDRLLKWTRSEFLITTAKDAVKLRDFPLPLLTLETELRLSEPQKFLETVLSQAGLKNPKAPLP